MSRPSAPVEEAGPVERMLAGTDQFIAALEELGVELDKAWQEINAFEGKMRTFRKILAETFADREVGHG